MGALSSINIIFKVDNKSLSTGLQNSVRDIKKTGGAMQDLGRSMSAYVTLPLLAAGGASVKMASDMQESQNKVSVAFKQSSGEVQAFAQTSLKSFGIAEGTALDMSAQFGDMATSMGLPEAAAAKMSTSLVGLAGDLASFKNIGIGQATTALNAVFTGETESLKMLGIVMTEANLIQFAMSKGIQKSIKDMTQAEKVQLRYAYVMENTANAQGDFMRTGAGAANQSRVMQEGMKQLGANIGKAVLPAYTSLVTAANDMLSGLMKMDEGTRDTIVTMGLMAAAAGPVILGIGSVIKAYGSLKLAAAGLNAAMMANPVTAIVTAVAGLAAVALVATSRFTPLTNATKEFNSVMASASDKIADQSAEMNKNLAIAKNDIYSKEQRLQAVKNLNALSPQYLGNLTLENINTQEATKATEAYTAALLQNAKVMAAKEKLVAVEKQLLDLQLGQLDAVKPSVWQNLGAAIKSGGDARVYAVEASKILFANLKEENSELIKLRQNLVDFVGQNETAAESQKGLTASTEALNFAMSAGAKAGTIDYFKQRIDEMEKLKNSTATSRAEAEGYEKAIARLQQNIDRLEGKRVIVEVITIEKTIKSGDGPGMTEEGLQMSKAVEDVNMFRKRAEDHRKAAAALYLPGSEEFQQIEKFATSLEKMADTIENPIGQINTQMIEDREALKENYEGAANDTIDFANAMQNAFGSLVSGAIDGFGELIGQIAMGEANMGDLFNMILSQIGEFIINLGKALITAGTAALAFKTLMLSPLQAIATGVLTVAIGSIMKSAMKNTEGFADGGIVGGASYTGDKLFARVNSGEMILNQKQQQNIWDMIQPAGANVNINLDGAFRLKGSDLELVLDRVSKINNRTK